MMLKVEQGVQEIWECDDEDPTLLFEASVHKDALSQDTKEHIQSYGLSKVSIATVVRWYQ